MKSKTKTNSSTPLKVIRNKIMLERNAEDCTLQNFLDDVNNDKRFLESEILEILKILVKRELKRKR